LPLVVPVAIGAPPYDADVLWRAFSAGDTTSAPYRAQYGYRSCDTPTFGARNLGFCRALGLTPWLVLPEALPDSLLVRRALMHADSLTNLSFHADSAGDADHLIVLVAGERRQPQEIQVSYESRFASYPARFDSAVLGSIPVARDQVTELEFAEAIVTALRLPRHSLVRDQSDTLFLHPETRYELFGIQVKAFKPGDEALFDVGVYQCGHLDCVHVAAPLVIPVRPGCPYAVYVSAEHRRGVLLEQALPLAQISSRPGELWRQLIPTGQGMPVHCPISSNSGEPIATVTWNGERASLVAH
jgi:hypothetical protein